MSRGFWGAMAGLGQGMQMFGGFMFEDIKQQRLEAFRAGEAEKDRQFRADQARLNREQDQPQIDAVSDYYREGATGRRIQNEMTQRISDLQSAIGSATDPADEFVRRLEYIQAADPSGDRLQKRKIPADPNNPMMGETEVMWDPYFNMSAEQVEAFARIARNPSSTNMAMFVDEMGEDRAANFFGSRFGSLYTPSPVSPPASAAGQMAGGGGFNPVRLGRAAKERTIGDWNLLDWLEGVGAIGPRFLENWRD